MKTLFSILAWILEELAPLGTIHDAIVDGKGLGNQYDNKFISYMIHS